MRSMCLTLLLVAACGGSSSQLTTREPHLAWVDGDPPQITWEGGPIVHLSIEELDCAADADPAQCPLGRILWAPDTDRDHPFTAPLTYGVLPPGARCDTCNRDDNNQPVAKAPLEHGKTYHVEVWYPDMSIGQTRLSY